MTIIDSLLRRFGGGVVSQYLDMKSINIDIEPGGYVTIRNVSLPIEIYHPIIPFNLKRCNIGYVRVCAGWKSALRYNSTEKLHVEVSDLSVDIDFSDFLQWNNEEFIEFLIKAKSKVLKHWETAFKTFGNFNMFDKIGFNVANSLDIKCTNLIVNFNADLEGFNGYVAKICIPEAKLNGCDNLTSTEVYGVKNSLLLTLAIQLYNVTISLAPANDIDNWTDMTMNPFDCTIDVKKWSPRALGIKSIFKTYNFSGNPAVDVIMRCKNINLHLDSGALDFIFTISGYFFIWNLWQSVCKESLAVRPTIQLAHEYVNRLMSEQQRLEFERQCPIEILLRLINENNKWFKYPLKFTMDSGFFTVTSDVARIETILNLSYKVYERYSSKLVLTFDKIYVTALSQNKEYPIVYSSCLTDQSDNGRFKLVMNRYTDRISKIDIKIPRLKLGLGNALAITSLFPERIGGLDRLRESLADLTSRNMIPKHKSRTITAIHLTEVDIIAILSDRKSTSTDLDDKFAPLKEYKYPYYFTQGISNDIISTDSSDENLLQLIDQTQFLESHQIDFPENSFPEKYSQPCENTSREKNSREMPFREILKVGFVTSVDNFARLKSIHENMYLDQLVKLSTRTSTLKYLTISVVDFIIFTDKQIDHLSFTLGHLALNIEDDKLLELEDVKIGVLKNEVSTHLKAISLSLPLHLYDDVILNYLNKDYLIDQVYTNAMEFYRRVNSIVILFKVEQECYCVPIEDFTSPVSDKITLRDSGIEFPIFRPLDIKIKVSTTLRIMRFTLKVKTPKILELISRLSLNLILYNDMQVSACVKLKSVNLLSNSDLVIMTDKAVDESVNFLQFDINLQKIESSYFKYELQSAFSISNPIINLLFIKSLLDNINELVLFINRDVMKYIPKSNKKLDIIDALGLVLLRLTGEVRDFKAIILSNSQYDLIVSSSLKLKALYDLATGSDSVPPSYIKFDGIARHLLLTLDEIQVNLNMDSDILYSVDVNDLTLVTTLVPGREEICFKSVLKEKPQPEVITGPKRWLNVPLPSIIHKKSTETYDDFTQPKGKYRNIVQKIRFAMRLGVTKETHDLKAVEPIKKTCIEVIDEDKITSRNIIYAMELIIKGLKVWAHPDSSSSRGVIESKNGLNLLVNSGIDDQFFLLQTSGLLGISPIKCVMTLSIRLGRIYIYMDSRPILPPKIQIASNSAKKKASPSRIPLTLWVFVSIDQIILCIPPRRISSITSNDKFAVYQLELNSSIYGFLSGLSNEDNASSLWNRRHIVTGSEWKNLNIPYNTFSELQGAFTTEYKNTKLVSLLSVDNFMVELHPTKLAERLPHLRLLSDNINGTLLYDYITGQLEADCKLYEIQLYRIIDEELHSIVTDSSAVSGLTFTFYGSKFEKNMSITLADMRIVVDLSLLENLTTLIPVCKNVEKSKDIENVFKMLNGIQIVISTSNVSIWLVKEQRIMSQSEPFIKPAIIERLNKINNNNDDEHGIEHIEHGNVVVGNNVVGNDKRISNTRISTPHIKIEPDYESRSNQIDNLSGFGITLYTGIKLFSDSIELNCEGISLNWGAPDSCLFNVEILSISNITGKLTCIIGNNIENIEILIGDIQVKLPLLLISPIMDFRKCIKKMLIKFTPKSTTVSNDLKMAIRLNVEQLSSCLYSGISSIDSTLLSKLSLFSTFVLLDYKSYIKVAFDSKLSLYGYNDLLLPFPILHNTPLSITLYCGDSNKFQYGWSASAELGDTSLVLSSDLCLLLKYFTSIVFQTVGSTECLVYNELEQQVGLDISDNGKPVLIPHLSVRKVKLPLSHVFNSKVLFIDETVSDKMIFDRRRTSLLLYGNTNDVSNALINHWCNGDKIWGSGTSLPMVAPIVYPGAIPCLVLGSILRVENRTRLTLTIINSNDAVTKTFNMIGVSDLGSSRDRDNEPLILTENSSFSIPISWLESSSKTTLTNESGDAVKLPDIYSLAFKKYNPDKTPLIFSKSCGVSCRLDFSPSWGTRPRCLIIEPMIRCHNFLPWPVKISFDRDSISKTIRSSQFAGICWGEANPTISLQVLLKDKTFDGRFNIVLKEGWKTCRLLTYSDDKLPVLISASRHVLSISIPLILYNNLRDTLYVNHRQVAPEGVLYLGDPSVRIAFQNSALCESSISHKVNLSNPVRGVFESCNAISWSTWSPESPLNSTIMVTLESLFCVTNRLDRDIFIEPEGVSIPLFLAPGLTIPISFALKATIRDSDSSFDFEFSEREEIIQRYLGSDLINVRILPIKRRSRVVEKFKFKLQKSCGFEIVIDLGLEPNFVLYNNTDEIVRLVPELTLNVGEHCAIDVIDDFIELYISNNRVVVSTRESTSNTSTLVVTKSGFRRLYLGGIPEAKTSHSLLDAKLSLSRLSLTLYEDSVLAALHLIGVVAHVSLNGSSLNELSNGSLNESRVEATINSLHVDHFIPGGGIPAIIQTSDIGSTDHMPFLDLIFKMGSFGNSELDRLAMFIELLSVKVSPICINIEFTVIKRITSCIRRMIPLLESIRPKHGESGQDLTSYYMQFGLVEVSPLSTTISIRTGGQEYFQDLFALKVLEWLPLDTPKITFKVNGEKFNNFAGKIEDLAKCFGTNYLRQLLRQSIPNVWLSYPLAFLMGIIRALGSMVRTPIDLLRAPISKEASRLEAVIVGSRIGLMSSLPLIIGGAFQTLGHTLNMIHKICGGQKVTPIGIIDSLWLSINGMLADIFYYPWKSFTSEQLSISNGIGITLVGYALSCIRCAACPILGIINFLTIICEGFSNTLIGDFEQFAHLTESPG